MVRSAEAEHCDTALPYMVVELKSERTILETQPIAAFSLIAVIKVVADALLVLDIAELRAIVVLRSEVTLQTAAPEPEHCIAVLKEPEAVLALDNVAEAVILVVIAADVDVILELEPARTTPVLRVARLYTTQ